MRCVLFLSTVLLLIATAGSRETGDKGTPLGAVAHSTKSTKALLEEYVAAWNRHDPDALDGLLDSQSVHEDIPAGFHGKGVAQIKGFAAEVFKAQPDLKWHLTTIVVSGTTAAAEWTWTATYTGDGPNGPVKGQKISARGASVIVTDQGHIRRFVDYYDFFSAFPAPAAAIK